MSGSKVPTNRAVTAVCWFSLAPHPSTPRAGAAALQASLERTANHWLLRYQLTGDTARLRVPGPAADAAFSDGLWRHTCFEAFVGCEGDAAYREFNFSPSGHWAAYAFSAERVPAEKAPPLPTPLIACDRQAHALTLQARVPVGALPAPGAAGYLIGLSAVIEDTDGQLSYWALHHPAARPDFHHRGGWTARVPALAARSA